jgi:hypothetical protein
MPNAAAEIVGAAAYFVNCGEAGKYAAELTRRMDQGVSDLNLFAGRYFLQPKLECARSR